MEFMIPLNGRDNVPLYQQIYNYIKEEIRSAGLPARMRVPSTRALADQLKVSRSTAQMAYEQLMSEGYIEAVPWKGYYVCDIESMGGPESGKRLAVCEFKTAGSGCAAGEANPADMGTEKVKTRRELSPPAVDFSPRGIDLGSFPFSVWRKLSRNTLVDDNREIFSSGDPQGEKKLRQAIGAYLHGARGVVCDPEQIVVGAGSEYLLMLLVQILSWPGAIAMENPTYRQAYRVFESLDCQVVPVPMDGSGMRVDALRQTRADIAYVMPSHQYPTGVIMPVKRRQEILSWAGERAGRYVIEDDYDSEFRYRGKPIPALQGMDGEGRVIYIGTFSKSVAPAIRVGYMVLPPALLDCYRRRMRFYSSTVSRIDQEVLWQFMDGGYYERHLNRMRAVYRNKHDRLMAELKGFENEFEIRGENAGLHVLLTHRGGRSEEELISLAAGRGIRVYALSDCYISEKGAGAPAGSTVILGYANLSEEEIARGIAALKEAWKE